MAWLNNDADRCAGATSPNRLWPAFWQHDPASEHSAQAWIDSTLRFYDITRTSIVKLTGPAHYQVADRGVEGSWQGAPLGERTFTRRAVHTPSDWYNLPAGFTRSEETVVSVAARIRRELSRDVPLLVTVFAPGTQAMMLAGPSCFVEHIKSNPGIVHEALARLAGQTNELIDRFAAAGADGIFLVSKHHDPTMIPEDDYRTIIETSDRQTMDTCQQFPANIFHLHGLATHGSGWPPDGNWMIHPETAATQPGWSALKTQTRHPLLISLPYPLWEEGGITPAFRCAIEQSGQRLAIAGAPCAVPLRYTRDDIAGWVKKGKEYHAVLAG